MALLAGFTAAPAFTEQVCEFTLEPEVKVRLIAPVPLAAPEMPIELVLYALPNGNTTDQTVGRALQPGDDWHFDIQHIGAQTRFLRAQRPERPLVVAYLEATGRSWPAWRRGHSAGSAPIPGLVEAVRQRLGDWPVRLTLSGHSGGGSVVFGYLDAVERIPDDVDRIAFLDSTYAYDSAKGHATKLAAWLLASPRHALCVIAYDDSVALYQGRPVVSATGGTWYRSHRLQEDLARTFPFETHLDDATERFSALEGRVQFILWKNPKRAILHTVLVERNGFIHSLLCGTPAENQGYVLFGPRAYSPWIAPAPL